MLESVEEVHHRVNRPASTGAQSPSDIFFVTGVVSSSKTSTCKSFLHDLLSRSVYSVNLICIIQL